MLFKKKFWMLCLACVLILGCSALCVDAVSDCKLTVKLYDENKHEINGMSVSICKIADIHGTDYIPTDAFADSGISISEIVKHPTEEAAIAVCQYVKKNHIQSKTVSSKKGEALFETLDRAIWLVYCEEEQEYKFNPYFVFLPQTINGKVQYEVCAEPKVEHNKKEEPNNDVIKDEESSNGKLPQTGQLWWPILMLVIAGGCFVTLGVMNLRNKKNEE